MIDGLPPIDLDTPEGDSAASEPASEQQTEPEFILGFRVPATTLRELEEMNERHALVVYGGRTRFLHVLENRRADEAPYQFIDLQSMKNYYKDRQVNLLRRVTQDDEETWQPVKKSLFWAWENWSGRRRYGRVCFYPAGKAPDDTFNMWEGWPYEQVPGSWKRLQRHIYEVVCKRDSRKFKWLIDHLTHVLQTTGQPHKKSPVSPVIWGKKGGGKSLVFDCFSQLFGSHGITVSQSDQLVGKFNKHLMLSVYDVVEEAVFARDAKIAGPLKDLMTRSTLTIEPKGVDLFTSPNYCRFAFISNDSFAVPMTEDERRFQPFEISDHRVDDDPYFDAIFDEWNNGGREAMFHDLMTRSYDEKRVRRLLDDDSDLAAMKALSLDPVTQFGLAWLYEGYVTLTASPYDPAIDAEQDTPYEVVGDRAHYLNLKYFEESRTPSAAIKKAYDLWCRENLDKFALAKAQRSTGRLTRELRGSFTFLEQAQNVGKEKVRGLKIPRLVLCRELIAENPVYVGYLNHIGIDLEEEA